MPSEKSPYIPSSLPHPDVIPDTVLNGLTTKERSLAEKLYRRYLQPVDMCDIYCELAAIANLLVSICTAKWALASEKTGILHAINGGDPIRNFAALLLLLFIVGGIFTLLQRIVLLRKKALLRTCADQARADVVTYELLAYICFTDPRKLYKNISLRILSLVNDE